LLARAAARQRELAIRTALGARRADIVRQMLAESLLVSLGGGLIGTALALAGVRAAATLLAAHVPRAEAVQVDAAVLVFSLLISIATGLAFGLAPAWQAATVRPQDAMTDTSRTSTAGLRHQRLRAWLVVIEIAGALILIGSATLLARSLLRLQAVDPGFRTDHLLVVDLDMTSTVFGRGEGRTPTDVFFVELMTRVARMPGVRAVAGTNTAPMTGVSPVGAAGAAGRTGAAATGGDPGTALTVEGEPFRSEGESPRAQRMAITPGYFETLGVPLRRGRAFTDDDRAERPPVAIVNETMAARLWPGQNPIGRRFPTLTHEGVARMRGRGEPDARIFRWTEVVGVVADLRTQALREPPRPQMYVPWRQYPWHTAQLMVQTTGAPLALAASVRAESRRLQTAAIVTRVSSMHRIVSGTAAQPRLGALVLALFAGAGLLLAAIGLYGVMAHTVTQRTAEVGIRMALGATRAGILRLVLRQGLLLTAGGLTLGLLGTRLTTRLLQPMLYDTSPADPLALTGTILLLTSVALAAAAIPAWRAARVDPLVALRTE
jgi:putative ABC transport system permease protein